ncbi:tyrosine-type recombinase/integrase, partial [Fusicatenibacter sp. CLA-AA-H213]|nr:tyrosine-type recombinase/integrase [Fusicatenibacter sp. CLA-AA-H213]
LSFLSGAFADFRNHKNVSWNLKRGRKCECNIEIQNCLFYPPHIFRHTYATKCVEYGLNPNAIQKLLGHATLDMLSVYAHPSTEFLKEECKKYNFYYEKDRNDTNEKVIPIDFRKNSV